MDERLRSLDGHWSITIPSNFDIKLFDLMWMDRGVWVIVCCGHCLYLRLRCAVFFLLKSNYLTRSKCGDSNYHYTCNNSNQWTRTTAQNDSLAFKLEKRNYVACEIVVQGLHSLFSLSIYKHPLCHHMCLWQSVYRFSISMVYAVCVSLYARCTIHTHQMTTTPTPAVTLTTIFARVHIRI